MSLSFAYPKAKLHLSVKERLNKLLEYELEREDPVGCYQGLKNGERGGHLQYIRHVCSHQFIPLHPQGKPIGCTSKKIQMNSQG